jgi:hypothetical protein
VRLEQFKHRSNRLLGRFFAVMRERLRAFAKQFGVRHVANPDGCRAGRAQFVNQRPRPTSWISPLPDRVNMRREYAL